MEDLGAAQVGERSRMSAQAAQATRSAPLREELVLYDLDDGDVDPSGLCVSTVGLECR